LFVNRLVLALTLLALCSLSFAGDSGTASVNSQQEGASAEKAPAVLAVTPLETSACTYTFTTGAGESFLQFCVTVNGNVTQFEAPQGFEHIRHGVFGEGYGVCDLNSGTEYFDYADFGDSPDWNPSTLLRQTATSVKIARTTIDGIWTLTQTFTQVAGPPPFVKVDMSLKNNTAIDRTVYLVRWADVEPDHLFTASMGATSNSAFAWDQTNFFNAGFRSNFGLMLQGVALPQQLFPDVGPQGFIQTSVFQDPPPPCNPYAFFFSGTPPEFSGSLSMLYSLGVPHRASKAITVNYKGM
jgi:hypothetical protein